jgi:hypothetical protein
MAKRRAGRVVVTLLLLAAVAGVAFAARGRLAPIAHTLDEIASASAWPALSALTGPPPPPAPPPPPEGGVPTPDGGRAPQRRQTAPLSSAQLGAPLAHGTFVSACGAPDDMKVVLKVTVKMGRATEAQAKTTPPNPVVESCVERATRDMQWDISPKTAHVTVRY